VDVKQEPVPAFAIDAVVSVLTALRDHPARDGESPLPIVGVMPPDEAVAKGSTAMLLHVADRKVDCFGDQLRRSVQDFDEVYAQTALHLQRCSSAGRHVVHGDLCPPNILLGPDLTVSAVIDWGFLSHVGESAFDGTIACGTYDMYGPFARQHEEELVSAWVSRHNDDRHRLLVYRALYAILTSNAYSNDGTDGHYEWCVATLNRADIRDALFS
jgi:aminoglycoside phosphotransferase (APT) family kinase protein